MTDRLSEFGVLALTATGWGVVIYVVTGLPVDPGTQAVFYTSGFVALAGSVALLLEMYYARVGHRDPRPLAVNLLGQGSRFAFMVEFALWLQSLRMLTAAYLVFLIAGYLFVELLFHRAAEDRGSRGT